MKWILFSLLIIIPIVYAGIGNFETRPQLYRLDRVVSDNQSGFTGVYTNITLDPPCAQYQILKADANGFFICGTDAQGSGGGTGLWILLNNRITINISATGGIDDVNLTGDTCMDDICISTWSEVNASGGDSDTVWDHNTTTIINVSDKLTVNGTWFETFSQEIIDQDYVLSLGFILASTIYDLIDNNITALRTELQGNIEDNTTYLDGRIDAVNASIPISTYNLTNDDNWKNGTQVNNSVAALTSNLIGNDTDGNLSNLYLDDWFIKPGAGFLNVGFGTTAVATFDDEKNFSVGESVIAQSFCDLNDDECFILGNIDTTIGNETPRFDNLVGTNCTAGDFVSGHELDGTVYCETPAGGSTSEVNATFNNTFGAISGFTSNSYNGNFSNDSHIGYDRMDAVCNSEFSGSHFCLCAEILKANINGVNHGVQVWCANGPPGFPAAANDCEGRTKVTDEVGAFWDWTENDGDGAGKLTVCASSIKSACCGGT